MRKPAKIGGLLVAFGLLWADYAVAQERSLNRVADGDFESGFVSLSLPAAEQFPMFSGGWASRGRRVPDAVQETAFEGLVSMRIDTRPADPLQVIQDLPVNSPAYGMRFAFFIERGSQTVRLLDAWDRGRPDSGTPAFEARISTTGIRFTTPAGSWQFDGDVAPRQWHTLSVIADPRTDTQSVRLDGVPLILLPGVSPGRPSTIVLGGSATDSGAFRYDAIEVMSLVDLELSMLRDAVSTLDIAARGAIGERLAAAAAALDRGSTVLALPELGVARNMLGTTALATENLRLAIEELMELMEASSERSERRREQ
jgi:hypothetical protein